MAEQRPLWERALSFSEKRRLKSLTARAARIADLEPQMQKLSDDELRAKTAEFMERFRSQTKDAPADFDGRKRATRAALDELLPEAFAACREAGVRFMQMRHFDVQLIGGMALHEGSVSEMLTGEGKTLVATLPLYLNSLTGRNVHLVTTNDYLAKRDAEWMRPLYEGLGLTVGSLWNQQKREDKRIAYGSNITYGTNSEFGFDYLRDNMAFSLEELMQRDHYFAIVDEADSILIDEARTPLIISGQPEEAAETYFQFAKIAAKMEEDEHFEFDEKMHTAHPTEEGVALAEKMLGIDNLYLADNSQLINHLNQAIRARSLYHRDKEYVVVPGESGELEVKIVDEHTGRIMEGRRWSEGLHQAIEAKENVRPQEENVTVASITIQNYFRLYEKLAGMTGTAQTEAAELKEIYNLDVVEVPPNRPVSRKDEQDFIFATEQGKLKAVVNDIAERHESGQPVLVGTIAVEKSEELAQQLRRKGIPHEVLNAKNHEREAEIILDAGQKGAVTIATNMAGRGVDIKLGEGVKELGGLYVLGTERHESRRIDNQLRGRSGRQGDPGESRFFLSAQDDLVRIFAGDRMERVLGRFHKEEEDVPLHAAILSRTIKNAQKRVEERNFVMRKNVLKYDDVLNTQRHVIYEERRKVLDGADLSEQIVQWLQEELELAVGVHTQSPYPQDWELKELWSALNAIYPVRMNQEAFVAGQFQDPESGDAIAPEELQAEQLGDIVIGDALGYYAAKEEQVTAEVLRDVERLIFLQVLDTRWREHLDNMDYLRDGIGLRGLAQKDPLNEYRSEGFAMFNEMQEGIQSEVVRLLMFVEVDSAPGEQGQTPAPPRERPRRAGTDTSASSNGARNAVGDGDGEGQGEESAAAAAATAGAGAAVGTGAATPVAPRRGGRSWASGGTLSYSSGGGQSAMEAEKAARGEATDSGNGAVTQRVVEDKVGRNDPCPCGSGKKYKACHGK
jgi:preprotein translocase subunit SecA